jgi:hypothetical protein
MGRNSREGDEEARPSLEATSRRGPETYSPPTSELGRIETGPDDMKGTRANDGSTSGYAKQLLTGSAIKTSSEATTSEDDHAHNRFCSASR